MSSRGDARPPKVGFKKSRTGCQKCKTRRVKCDESKPICRQCSRLKLQCLWSEPRNGAATSTPSRPLAPAPLSEAGSSAHPSEAGSSAQPTAGEIPTVIDQAQRFSSILNQRLGDDHATESAFADFIDRPEFDYDELPESAERRLLEHRLMQNWFYRIVDPFPVRPGPEWANMWTKLMPPMALTNKNLMYGMLAHSATNLLKDNPEDIALFAARQSYLILAMREQRRMVTELTIDKTDAICFTSMLLLVNAFAMLQERQLEPYSPPMDWIYMGRGAGTLIWASVNAIVKSGDTSKSSLLVIANSYPYFGDDRSYWGPEMRRRFDGILSQTIPSDDIWDDETREGYETTLSYVGSIQKAIDAGEPLYIICRRVQVFSLVVLDKFVEMLSEQRPRALVVIAHFFATVAQLEGVWWLGEARGTVQTTARREVEAIRSVIPPEWNGHMIWPMDMVRMGQLPVPE